MSLKTPVVFEIVSGMDLAEVRRTVIIAMFSDDVLMDQVVLKGGNALTLVYGLGQRSSLDVDLSIDGDFASFDGTQKRIFAALHKRFEALGCEVFDERFEKKPAEGVLPEESRWGGYVAEFKLIERHKYLKLNGNLDAIRRESMVTGPLQRRSFRIELSKHEFCRGKAEKELDDYTVYVYTPEMIMIEKLRAICQQMPEYTTRGYKTARARDFYDIHTLATEGKIDIANARNLALAKDIFAAKHVPLAFIAEIPKFREFHRPDWPSVEAAVTGKIESFDYYFNYVVAETLRMKSLWVGDAPK